MKINEGVFIIMATSTLNISLPETQRIFVEQKIKNEGYSTISEYVRELIRAEQRKDQEKELQREELRKEIMKGVDDINEGRYTIYNSGEEIAEAVIARAKQKGKLK